MCDFTFKWSLGIETGIQIEVTAERVGIEGVRVIGFTILSGADDLSYVAYLLETEADDIEQHAYEAMRDLDRAAERFFSAEEEEYA